jgi:hypothetical protein
MGKIVSGSNNYSKQSHSLYKNPQMNLTNYEEAFEINRNESTCGSIKLKHFSHKFVC